MIAISGSPDTDRPFARVSQGEELDIVVDSDDKRLELSENKVF